MREPKFRWLLILDCIVVTLMFVFLGVLLFGIVMLVQMGGQP